MKIVLVNSPGLRRLEIYQSIGVRAPPLGLAYIASILEGEGHRVKIIDAPTLELGVRDVVWLVKREAPDVVGISAVTPTVKSGYLVAKYLKEEYDWDLPIIMGGPHVSALYNEALSTGYVDYVVVGEGEFTSLELVRYIESGRPDLREIRGVAYRVEGVPRFNGYRELIRDLDILPRPARHLLPMDRYTLFDKPIRIVHIMASRGCPYGCIYCTTSYLWGRRYRIRSPESVVDEIEEALDKYNTRIVAFTDDELTLSKRWVLKFTELIMDRGLDITYTCGSRVSNVDREVLAGLSRSGCSIIYYGIESYKDEDLVRIGKKVTISQVWRAVELTHLFGLEAAGSFILGFPWQTIDDMKNIVKFSIDLGLDYAQFTAATPFPGTPLYEYAKSMGFIEVWDWSRYTTIQPIMRGYRFSLDDVRRLLHWAYQRFYLRPKYLVKEVLRHRIKNLFEVIKRGLFGIHRARDENNLYIKDLIEIENSIRKGGGNQNNS